MFFRSKDGKDTAPPGPSPVQADKAAPPRDKTAALPTHPATPRQGTAPAVTTAPNADRPLPQEELSKRAEAAQREAAAIGQIVTLMVGSKPHQDRKLSDLRVTVLPAIRTGQYAVASGQWNPSITKSVSNCYWICA
jgi:hypothetical protein